MKINFFTIIKQIYTDWFGKDAQTDYTYSYIWQANQFGHFGLGFISSVLIFWILMLNHVSADLFYFVLVGQTAFWGFKEIRDYFVLVKQACSVFPIDKGLIIKDLLTDVSFILFGALVAYLGFGFSIFSGLIAFAIGLIPTLFLFVFWVRLKIHFQISGTPFYYRLGSFGGKLSSAQVSGIEQFVKKGFDDSSSDWQHLLIFGPCSSVKTSLSVGIATDHTVQRGLSRYISFNHFIDVLNQNIEHLINDAAEVVRWRSAEMLVIDNVSGGSDIRTPFNPQLLHDLLIRSEYKDLNIETLQKQKTVWVVGNDSMASEWVGLFTKLELNKKGKVVCLKLNETVS
jgi:hypothetical protein